MKNASLVDAIGMSLHDLRIADCGVHSNGRGWNLTRVLTGVAEEKARRWLCGWRRVGAIHGRKCWLRAMGVRGCAGLALIRTKLVPMRHPHSLALMQRGESERRAREEVGGGREREQ
eukprot:1682664-Rhodomonas_salina.1